MKYDTIMRYWFRLYARTKRARQNALTAILGIPLLVLLISFLPKVIGRDPSHPVGGIPTEFDLSILSTTPIAAAGLLFAAFSFSYLTSSMELLVNQELAIRKMLIGAGWFSDVGTIFVSLMTLTFFNVAGLRVELWIFALGYGIGVANSLGLILSVLNTDRVDLEKGNAFNYEAYGITKFATMALVVVAPAILVVVLSRNGTSHHWIMILGASFLLLRTLRHWLIRALGQRIGKSVREVVEP